MDSLWAEICDYLKIIVLPSGIFVNSLDSAANVDPKLRSQFLLFLRRCTYHDGVGFPS